MKKTFNLSVFEVSGILALVLLGSSFVIERLSVILAFAASIPTMIWFLHWCLPEEDKDAVTESTTTK